MNRVLRVVLLLAIVSCDSGPTAPAAPVTRVDVAGAPAENVLLVGGTVQLTAAARDAGGRALERRVNWATSDPTIAQVSPAGLVTAIASGVVVITAESGGQTGAVGLAVRVAVPVPPSTASGPVTTQLLGNSLSLTIAPGAATASTLTVGRALVLTDDTRILTSTAFAIGPAGVTFAAPVTAEVSLNLAALPVAKRAGVRLIRVTPEGDIEGIDASSVDQGRSVLVAPLTRTGTYVAIVPGDPAQLLLPEGSSRRVEVGTTVPGIAVVAIDAVGRPVFGASIAFSIEGATGSIVGDTIAFTDFAGRAELPGDWIAGPAKGNYALRARVLGTSLSAQFTATAFAPAVAVAIRSAPTAARSGVLFSEPILVELVDADGDRAEVTQPVSLTLIDGAGTLNGTTQEMAVNGGAIFQGQRIDGPGTYRLVASSAGLAPDTSAAIEVTQSVARVEILTQPAGAQSGVPFTTQPVVELRDDAGFRVIGGDAVVTVFAQGPGILFGTRSVAAVDGVATFTDLAVDGEVTLQLNFTSGGAVNVLSQEIVVGPPPPGIRLLVGPGPVIDVIPGQISAVSLNFDLSTAGGDNIRAVDVTMTWDPARFAYFNYNAGIWSDSTNTAAIITVDESQAASGVVRFVGSTPDGTVNSFWLGAVLLQTLPVETTTESVIGAAVNSATNAAGAPVSVTARPTIVTITPQPSVP